MKTEYLLHREVEHVLAALMPVNRVAMRVCIHTGLRVGDVLALRTDQIAPRFWVTEQKTKKRRIVGLPSDLLADMRKIAGKKYVLSTATTRNAIGHGRPYGKTSSARPARSVCRRTSRRIRPVRSMRWICWQSTAISPRCSAR